ncbi:MAG: hypothetical protein SF172_18700 [Burkholderiales bacterium]|nr:hypothetical protein [Burkholderiales bacterium]
MLVPITAVGTTSQVEASVAYVVKTQRLSGQLEKSWQKCLQQSPEAGAFAQHNLIRQYCLIRHGADRRHAVFIGVHAVALLESRGEWAAAAVIEKLSAYPDGTQ